MGILRSADATESSRWLYDIAQEIRAACGPDDPEASLVPAKAGRK
jgi:hypothetical protein